MTQNQLIGFMYYLKERNIEMGDYKKFTKEVYRLLAEYKRKYPNGLTNGGEVINFLEND